MGKVTDPALLQALEGGGPVTDPALLAELDGQAAPAAPANRWVQKAGEGLVPGYNRMVALADAALGDGGSFGERYTSSLRALQGQSRETQADAPWRSALLQTAGALPSAGMVVGKAGAAGVKALEGLPRLVRSMRAAREGAGLGAMYGAGDAPADGGVGTIAAHTAGGAALGGAMGGAAGAILPPAVPAQAAPGLAASLERRAAERALKSTAATKADIAKLTRESADRPLAIGRALLSEDVSLRSPQAIAEGTRGLRGQYGKEIGALVSKADEAGQAFDLASVVAKAKDTVLAPLRQNPLQKPTADRVAAYLDDIAAKGPAVPAREGHGIRQQLDEFLRGVRRAQDPESTFAKSAMNDIRHLVDAELGATMERAGLGPKWAQANRSFGLMADAQKLARRGVDRREGNRSFGFAEQVAGVPGAIVGAMGGGISGGGAGYAVGALGANLLKRYGNPVAARTLQSLSRVAGGTPPANMTPTPEAASIIAALRRRAGPEVLAAAAEDD